MGELEKCFALGFWKRQNDHLFVATRSLYVLVDASDENEAGDFARPALAELFRHIWGKTRRSRFTGAPCKISQ